MDNCLCDLLDDGLGGRCWLSRDQDLFGHARGVSKEALLTPQCFLAQGYRSDFWMVYSALHNALQNEFFRIWA
jgi:hypothetical protein